MLQAESRPDSLAASLAARIAAQGPLRLDDYMHACLLDERAGAYAAKQPIGAEGHFITAPEISQIFGELIGLYAVSVWQAMGEPRAVTVAELGPGRGTLLADAMRAWRVAPNFMRSVSVALIEASPVLAAAQRQRLQGAPMPLRWHERLDAVAEGPLIVIANEFVDALPIRQFVRRGGVWRERLIASDGGGFAFADGAPVAAEEQALADIGREPPEGAIFETRPAVKGLLRDLAARVANAPLAALIVDYGHEEQGFGNTLQAIRGHCFADPLTAPGEADLSAQVDFADLKRNATDLGLKAYGPMPQGEFLLKLGLGQRRERLLQRAAPEQQQAIASGAARLVDPAQMGVLFKALVLTSATLPPPPPFRPEDLALSSDRPW